VVVEPQLLVVVVVVALFTKVDIKFQQAHIL
jgi:hypothetical protein